MLVRPFQLPATIASDVAGGGFYLAGEEELITLMESDMGIPFWGHEPMDWPPRRETPVPAVDSDEGSKGTSAEPGEAEATEEDGPGDRDDVEGQSGGSEGA